MKTKCCLLPPLTHRPAGIWSPAGGWVSGAGGLRSSPTHQQGTHPCQGCCPCARWAEPNYPSVINKLPAPPPPCVKFMTEVTSMAAAAAPPCCISYFLHFFTCISSDCLSSFHSCISYFLTCIFRLVAANCTSLQFLFHTFLHLYFSHLNS